MILKDDNVIGIVGGMGPQAGVALYEKIINLTHATKDQQHLSTILMSFPKYLEDRTLFLEGATNINPAINIAKVIKKLNQNGAKTIGIACNTSYAPRIFKVILREIETLKNEVQLINMPYETCLHLKANYPKIKRVGLMTTNGTYKSMIYYDLLKMLGYEIVVPDYQFQNDVIHRMVYDPIFGIKANSVITSLSINLWRKAMCFFKENNAQSIILGCTEFALMHKSNVVIGDFIIVDSLDCLAKSLVEAAVGQIKV